MTSADEEAVIRHLLHAASELRKAIEEVASLGDGFVFHRRAAARLSSFLREVEFETPAVEERQRSKIS